MELGVTMRPEGPREYLTVRAAAGMCICHWDTFGLVNMAGKRSIACILVNTLLSNLSVCFICSAFNVIDWY